jgi:hypothetical protein
MSLSIDQKHPITNTISLPQSPTPKEITDSSKISPNHMITSKVPSAGQLPE